jgi:hypothetical protein
MSLSYFADGRFDQLTEARMPPDGGKTSARGGRMTNQARGIKDDARSSRF